MSDGRPSFLRHGSTRLLGCGALLCIVLFAAHWHVLATLVALISVAAAGAAQRLQEQSSEPSRTAQGTPAQRLDSGIATRQTLESRLDQEWHREGAAGQPTALLLIAVDASEYLHAHSGALAGDVAMLTLGSAVVRMLPRHADLLARYDDSTFAVLLSGTDLPGSLRVAARLRWAIVRLGIANPGTTSGFLTVCMGLAVQHGIGTTSGLLATAEGALASAQAIGHDSLQYVVPDDSESPPGAAAGSGLLLTAADMQTVPSAPPARLPAIRAWTPERAPALHSPQS
jgi:diguanylate cyclase (GGDEF)-like protein